MSPEDYRSLLPFATDRQADYVAALLKAGDQRRAAVLMGVNERTLGRGLEALRSKAARAGVSAYDDRTGTAPPGYHVKGKSTLYNAEGAIAAQWVRTGVDSQDRLEAMLNVVDELREDYRGIYRSVAAPKLVGADLMTVVPLGDSHIGLYAWMEECGQDFDLGIARNLMSSAAASLAKSVPPSAQCLIINLGDFFHADNNEARTARSNNALDVDTRWSKVLRTGVAAMRAMIDAQLRRHAQIKVVNCIGNHDDHSSHFLSLILAEAYHDEPRVEIVTSPAHFHYHNFGQCLIGATHGHTIKPERLPGIMAHDQSEVWGRTKWRHWYVGHFHQRQVWEFPGCTVEYCRTLAARDAWATAHGYRSLRDVRAIVYHRDHGEVGSHRVGVETL